MSITLLCITTILCVGFLFGIGLGHLARIPIAACIAVILSMMWILYRKTPQRKNAIYPHIQEYGLNISTAVALARGGHYRGGCSWMLMSIIIIALYAIITIRSIQKNNKNLYRIGVSGYITTYIISLITGTITHTTATIIILISTLIIIALQYYRKKPTIKQIVPYMVYGSLIGTLFVVIGDTRAAPIAIIILGIILYTQADPIITQEKQKEQHITAEMILQGENIYDHKHTPQAHTVRRLGNTQHSVVVIRSMLGIFAHTIIYNGIHRYTHQHINERHATGFLLISLLVTTLLTHYYTKNKTPSRLQLRKITAIILINISAVLNIVHLFSPDKISILIATITRNILNTIIVRYLQQHKPHTQLSHYRSIANSIIIVINSILLFTYLNIRSLQTVLIIAIIYRSTQATIIHYTNKQPKHTIHKQ